MIDTHCHLNFKKFKDNLPDVIERARAAGVNNIIVPGTDIETSQYAVEIAAKFAGIYAAVGIHPHHALPRNMEHEAWNINNTLKELEKLIVHPKVVAVGEIGLDYHVYQKTKYEKYSVTSLFVAAQEELFKLQIELAGKYKKAVILHNREATDKILIILNTQYLILNTKMVFHCCEPDDRLLDFAIKNEILIGVDGDVTYRPDKQEFVKKIPLELLVLETDSPYLLPELLRSSKLYPNEPRNIPVIANFIAKLKNVSMNQFINTTTENAKRLFSLSS